MMTRIEALRQIVATNKAAKLDGHIVDTFTAARLLESYKALDGAGRRRFASMSVDKMVTSNDRRDTGYKVYMNDSVSEISSDLKSKSSRLKHDAKDLALSPADQKMYTEIADTLVSVVGEINRILTR